MFASRKQLNVGVKALLSRVALKTFLFIYLFKKKKKIAVFSSL